MAAVAASDRGLAGRRRRGTRAWRARGGRSGPRGCRGGRSRRARSAGWSSTRRSSASLLMSRIWPIDGFVGVARRRTGSCRRRGRSRSTRAASSRRGSASGRSRGAPRPAGRISNSTCGARAAPAPRRCGRGRAGDHARARAQALELDRRARSSAEEPAEVAARRSRPPSTRRCARTTCWAPPAPRGVRARRVREQALLGRRPRRRLAAASARRARPACARRPRRAGRWWRTAGCCGRRVARRAARARAGRPRALAVLRLRRRVALGDLAEVRVGEGVAVDVLQLTKRPSRGVLADPHDAAVVDGDHRRAVAGEDLDAARGRSASTTQRGVALPGARLRSRCARAGRRRSLARATGKRPCVRPVSEPTRSAGRPPITARAAARSRRTSRRGCRRRSRAGGPARRRRRAGSGRRRRSRRPGCTGP